MIGDMLARRPDVRKYPYAHSVALHYKTVRIDSIMQLRKRHYQQTANSHWLVSFKRFHLCLIYTQPAMQKGSRCDVYRQFVLGGYALYALYMVAMLVCHKDCLHG